MLASQATGAVTRGAAAPSSVFSHRVFLQQFNAPLKKGTWSIYQGIRRVAPNSQLGQVARRGRRGPAHPLVQGSAVRWQVGLRRSLDGTDGQPGVRPVGRAVPDAPRSRCRDGRRASAERQRHRCRLDRGVVRPRRAAQLETQPCTTATPGCTPTSPRTSPVGTRCRSSGPGASPSSSTARVGQLHEPHPQQADAPDHADQHRVQRLQRRPAEHTTPKNVALQVDYVAVYRYN